MSEPASETQKPAKRSTTKTAPAEAEVVEQADVDTQPVVTETQQPTTTAPAQAAPLIIHNRPSTWIAATGIALVIFLFGYVTGIAMSHSRTMRPMQRHGMWQQEMRSSQSQPDSRNNSNIPSV